MVDRNAVRRGYDDAAEAYAASRSEDGRGMEILAGFLESLPESARVLDAGCGSGAPVLRRLEAVAIGVGLDFSRRQLELAATNVPDAGVVQGDMTRLPVRDDAFDAITAYHSLIHVPTEEHEAVLEEFARVLSPGGRLLLSEGVEAWEGTNPDWLESGSEMQWNIAGAETTREQLRNAGFAVDDEWGIVQEGLESDEQWTFFAASLESA